MYLLDSNVCIAWMRTRSPSIRNAFARIGESNIFLCSIVKAELDFGLQYCGNPPARARQLELFVSRFESLPFDDPCVRHYGELRARLTHAGQLIGPNDLLIAATALAHGAILVTHNIAEFSRVPGLLIEDWEA